MRQTQRSPEGPRHLHRIPCAGAVLSLAQTHRGRPQTTSTPNLPLGLRGNAGGGARVTAGPKRPHLSVCPCQPIDQHLICQAMIIYSAPRSSPQPLDLCLLSPTTSAYSATRSAPDSYLTFATPGEDWASQGQPKRKPDIPVVFENPDAIREKRSGSNVFTG